MEITTRHRRLIIAAFAAITCMLLWSLAAGSAQVVGTAQDPPGTPRSAPAAAVTSPTEFDPFEPDNTIDQANKIVVCTPQVHYFQALGDVDWVKFWAWADIEYTIETYDLSPINNTQLWLYDVYSNLLAHDDDGLASTIVWEAPANGTYFVEAAHVDFDGGDGFFYSLRVTDSDDPCGDDFEPDNGRSDATPVDVDGVSQQRTFHGPCGGDVDWAKFDAVTGTVYTIRTFYLSPGNDTILGLYDADGITVTVNGDEMVDDDDPENPPASRIDWMADKGGTYYVKVSPFNPHTGGCDLGYRLRVETSPSTPTPTPPPGACADEFEPDDNPGGAKPIAVNGGPQENRTIHVPGDEDWIKFWAFAGNEYTIQTSDLSPGNNTVLCLYDEDIWELKCHESIDPPGNLASRITWTAPAYGTYFVKVRHKYPDPGGCEFTYSLEITSSVPCRDDYEYEEDDTPEQAQPITVDGSAQIHNFYVPCACHGERAADEADWVRFDAVEGVTYTIKTSDLGSGNDTVLGLYGYPGNEEDLIAQNDDYLDDMPASRIVWKAPADGTYLVKVSPFESSAGGCGFDYRLEVSINPGPPHTLILEATSGLTVGQTSILTATVVDVNTNPVEDGTKVIFETGLGCFETAGGCEASTTVSTTGGVATAELASTEVGTAMVTATVGSAPSDTTTVAFNADVPYTLTLEANLEELAVGETSTLTATVVDQYDNAVTDGTEVVFETDLGILGSTVVVTETTKDGIATAALTSNEIGTARVIATAAYATDTCDVEFTPMLFYFPLLLKPPPNEPPYTPSTPSPPDGATGQATDVDLGWTGGDPDFGDTVTYDVYFGATCPPSTLVCDDVSSPACDPGTLDYNTLYYWYVVATDGYGAESRGPEEGCWDFTTNDRPNTPSNPSPPDGATGQTAEVDLSWSGGDPDSGDTVTYDVYFGSDSPPPLKETIGPYPATQTAITYDPGTLDYSTQYHWYIVARDDGGAESRGPGEGWWDFTTCTCNDEHEPDNSSQQALEFDPLESGEPVTGYICEEHIHLEEGEPVERDWYHFELTLDDWNQGLRDIEVALGVPEGVNYDLFLWVGDHWEESKNLEPGADEHIDWSAQGIGTYYVVVKSLGDCDNCTPYSLQVTLSQSQRASRILHQFWRHGLWGSPSYSRMPQP